MAFRVRACVWVGVALFSSGVFAEEPPALSSTTLTEISYESGTCHCTAQIDPSVIAPEKVKAAFELSKKAHSLNSVLMFWSRSQKPGMEDLKLKAESFSQQSQTVIDQLTNAELPPEAEWQKVREYYLRDVNLTRYLELAKLNYALTNDAKVLNEDFEGKPLPKKCRKYSLALGEAPRLDQTWKDIVQAHCKRSGKPSKCKENMETDVKGTTGEFWKRIQVLTFGWSNCLNDALRKEPPPEVKKATDSLRKKLAHEKCECEGP